ncbi:MAG: TIGR00730 family Rossman fold protein [Verrucomicrobiaceae bacterium]|nr:MAG: TIGR00730 family Rossman fold protein [Verrucomicrobiaceae bacterium]
MTNDSRIRALADEVADGKSAELIADLMETSLKLGRDNASIAELKLMSRALREMRYASKVFSEYHGIRKIAVFGSARTRPEAEEYKLAKLFAHKMVENDFMVITGGGDGIMGAAQEGAGAEKSFGLNIRLPFEQRTNETIHGDPKLINFNYFFTRKLNFAKETHAFALFPGGFGTHDEGCEILTLMQTGKMPIVPVVMLDRQNGHYWETWRRFIVNDLLDHGLVSPTDFHLFHITHDPDDAVNVITQFYKNFHSYRWVREKMVIRIQRRLTPAAIADLNARFDALIAAGGIEQTTALPEERDDYAGLPRIVLAPHKRDFGAIRLLLDAINLAETIS